MDKVQKLFRRINLEYPGLEKAREAFLGGDEAGAVDAIIGHFKTRKGPKYLFGKEEIQKFTDRGVIERADKVVNHIIWGYHLGETIDWRRNYNDVEYDDHEWVWSLSRNLFWQPLARAYALTGDEKYARTFVEQFQGFNAAWPVEEFMEAFDSFGKRPDDGAHCWRTIDSSIRMYCCWLPVMEYFRDSPSLTRGFWIDYLNLLHDHAEFWRKHYSFHVSCSNWISMEGTALLFVGTLYPEFWHAPEWFKLGYQRVMFETRYQFDMEGAHSERTPIYHLTAAGAYLQAYRLMTLNGIEVPPYALPLLTKAGAFLMKLVKPDFTTPMLGDADKDNLLTPIADTSLYEGMNNTMDAQDENEPRAFFRELHALTGRADFLYMATGRAQGEDPGQRQVLLPEQGLYVFRTGWQPRDSWWMVAATQLERGESGVHSHYDVGHLEVQIQGEDVLVDSGRYLYGRINDLRWRQYFISTRAHNTCQVDDVKTGILGPPLAGGRTVRTYCHGAGAGDGYEYVDISHNGFAHFDGAIFHRRRVVHVKPGAWIIVDDFTGLGEHDYKLFFNFEPKQLAPTERYGGFAYTGDRVQAELYPLLTDGVSCEHTFGSLEPFSGWISYGYAVKQPTHNVAYFTRGKAPARFATAFVAQGGSAAATQEDGVLRVEVSSGGNQRTILFEKDSFTVQ